MEELLTDRQLADQLKLKVSTIRRWSREGRIPTVWLASNVRRFRLSHVLEELESAETGGAQ